MHFSPLFTKRKCRAALLFSSILCWCTDTKIGKSRKKSTNFVWKAQCIERQQPRGISQSQRLCANTEKLELSASFSTQISFAKISIYVRHTGFAGYVLAVACRLHTCIHQPRFCARISVTRYTLSYFFCLFCFPRLLTWPFYRQFVFWLASITSAMCHKIARQAT